MSKIAVVQNQSEMAHYSHADCRSFLREAGYDFVLYTATNVERLLHDVTSGEFDALLIASNALHDKVIRSYFLSDHGRSLIEKLIAQSAGILILMQYKAAYDHYSFSFLPDSIAGVLASARPDNESATSAELADVTRQFDAPLTSYPNAVSLSEVEARARAYKNLGGGVYWHFWGGELEPYWNIHLRCELGDGRPLIISAKEHLGFRIVMSALPIDWHRHSDLFENILSFVVEGRHQTGVVKHAHVSSAAFEYFIATLRARKEGFKLYSDDETQLKTLKSNVLAGIHRTVVLGPDLRTSALLNESEPAIQGRIQEGTLRFISFGSAGDFRDLVISGRQNPAIDAYRLIVPTITQELQNGYLDGSFWSTISGLQAIEQLPGGLDFELFPVDRVLEESSKRDRDGSYDEVFGVTVALLWLRSKALGKKDPKTEQTVKWIRNHLRSIDAGEKIKAYTGLSRAGLSNGNDPKAVQSILDAENTDRASEIELFSLLEAAVHFEDEAAIVRIARELSTRQKDNSEQGSVWVDIPTTANLIQMLVAGHRVLSTKPNIDAGVLESIRGLIVPSMIAIEDAFQRSASSLEDGRLYPWDGKAATALRCLAAWYAFDQFLNAPVEEAAETVKRASKASHLSTIAESSLGTVRNLVLDRENMKEQLAAASTAFIERDKANLNAGRAVVWAKVTFLAAMFQAYLIFDHLIRTKWFSESLTFGQSLWTHFGTHATVLGTTAAVLAMPWKRIFRKLDDFLPDELPRKSDGGSK